MAIEVFNRIEKKYLITEDVYGKFFDKIIPYMEMDAFCKDGKFYSINNIYFDTENNDLIRTSIDKPAYKEKLRLRSYGVPEFNDIVFLEIKKKYNGIVKKRRTLLKLNQAYDFLFDGIMPSEGDYLNAQVLKELKFFMEFYNPVAKLFLAYDRVAMFGKDDENLRITADRNIRTRRDDLRLEDGDYGDKLLQDGQVLIEIKTASSFPVWLVDILTELDMKGTSFSKYGTEYRQFMDNTLQKRGAIC